uniref:FANCL C-terminal domain-containing protein n=1 Tax=Lutzomyia longipalpis TaxID=7200 RepID=A0A1B0CDH1_LUTLO
MAIFHAYPGNQLNSVDLDRSTTTACLSTLYSVTCLREYFDTLRGSKTMFTLAMGQCPFCRQKLTTFLDFVDEAE